MKYIIDGGGWNGRSVGRLRELYDPNGTAMVHTFEPHPAFASFYSDFENHQLHQEAVWIHDGSITFYLQESDPKHNKNGLGQGHSLMKEKGNVKSDSLEVPCIDFGRWLVENVTVDDEVIVKLDIEGAEYQVLQKLVEDRSIHLIDELLVEFHHEKYPSLCSSEAFEALIHQIPLEVKPW